MIITQKILLGKSPNCDIFIYEPLNIEEARLGNLYFIAELADKLEESSYLINLLASIIKREYYSKSDRGSFQSLEAGLKKANHALKDLNLNKGGKKNKSNYLNKLNCLCAVLSENQIYLSQMGEFRAFLFRQGSLIDITKKLISISRKTSSIKSFQNIISGKLEWGDKLFFPTIELLHLISTKKLKEIYASGNITENCEQIKQILIKKEKKSSFPIAALLLEITPEEMLSKRPNLDNSLKYITPPIYLKEIFE